MDVLRVKNLLRARLFYLLRKQNIFKIIVMFTLRLLYLSVTIVGQTYPTNLLLEFGYYFKFAYNKIDC